MNSTITNADKVYRLGIDIGSTTVKIAILDDNDKVLFSDYERHFANIQETLAALLEKASAQLGNILLYPMITGSGGLTLARHLEIPFVQEVVAVATALQKEAPQTDVAVELGGEDAKIIYFTGGIDQRMNGICAGGTGSFIDQMASLLQTDASGLNEYAKNYTSIYPIAARCGVFAKTDIQPLINEGATREDLAASIFQAVVNQTISGLSCGKPIRGHVAFLGGPLHFLSELRAAFIRTLNLTDDCVFAPDHSHLFAAIGAAENNTNTSSVAISDMASRLRTGIKMQFEIKRLDPLFKNEEDYRSFVNRHAQYTVRKGELATYSGKCFLGIDAGSTTTKAAVVGEDGSLLYSFYRNNNGSPLQTTIDAIKEIHSIIPETAQIVYGCSTGYGEALIKAALQLDEGEVETIAHYTAASFFLPEVDCILDIGGQDMKCIKIKNQSVDTVLLNEACSSGCGSFIETFAKSLNYSVESFAKEALFAANPIDLGTRCTVFMNSNVKQAQKEGATVADISAGLAYSVIKNALYKVIKITDPGDLGRNVVVQGGTFYNNAVLRAFERVSGALAVRPDIAGIMGAFGAALIARNRYTPEKKTSMLSIEEIMNLTYSTKMVRCGKCTNNCMLTINLFDDPVTGKKASRRYITGNRCERGLGKEITNKELPNLFDYKYKRVFDIATLTESEATRGVIGLPRVLNMYENYPFWATFFRKLGFSVVLSPASNRKIYEMGIESIPSESECYPAKIAHGHISWLIKQGIKTIFYPCVYYERNETPSAQNHYNCPIVQSYPENIKNNVEELETENVRFLHPFVALTDQVVITNQLVKVFKEEYPEIPSKEVREASLAAWQALIALRDDIRIAGEQALNYMEEHKLHGIVLAGRPYHVDPEINHGIPELLNSYGFVVFTEDSVSHMADCERPLIVMDQWMYHSRLYRAANFVKTRDDLDLVQLNSFGCGLDAVTTDCVCDILTNSGKLYTVLKIDEVSNLGAARIRIRSLMAAIREREQKKRPRTIVSAAMNRVEFTKAMKDYTIICPQMSPIHFDLLAAAIRTGGYNVVICPESKRSVDVGLKYVNNDACYPSLIVVGQMMDELMSGKYDLNKTAIFMTQTGGGCRASNYIGFIRRALANAGMSQIPVVSLSPSGIEKNEGLKYTPKILMKALQALTYGDIFMRVVYHTRPYEAVPGSVDELHRKWEKICIESLQKPGLMADFKKNVQGIIRDFDNIELKDENSKPKVGIVGEILVKFLPYANNHLAELLEAEGAEAVCPDLTDFLLYSFYTNNFKAENLGTSKKTAAVFNMVIKFIEMARHTYYVECKNSKRFTPPSDIRELGRMAEEFVSLGNQTGEGWFLTGEMMELIHNGVPNIVCTQPFACLPNHIVGKGVIKQIRRRHPEANIIAVDYAPGASEVNQLNRIKLMLSTANKNLAAQQGK